MHRAQQTKIWLHLPEKEATDKNERSFDTLLGPKSLGLCGFTDQSTQAHVV